MSGGRSSERLPSSPPTVGPGLGAHPSVRVPLTTILGRDQAIAHLEALLDRDDTRLVTLTGPGGIGKTRLALEVAARVQDDFAHGACFVSLASIRDPELVPGAVAEALGLRERGGQSLPEALVTVLRPQHLLLVLDNFEQVAAASLWLADLLAACPRVKALVTTRVLLRIQGEQHVPVPPLPVPNGSRRQSIDALAETPSLALFVERARAIVPEFSLNEANVGAVRGICHRLDGLPLAIELAAARVNVLSPAAILARLTDRLALLTGNMRDVPPRLQTMRNAIAWSHDLLSADERRLFRRLAIFSGSFTLADAVAVGLDDTGGDEADGPTDVEHLQQVASLLNQSLIQQAPSEHGESRFRMLGTIREFGMQQLDASGEGDLVARRHALYVLSLAERASPELTGPEQVKWLNRLEDAHDDIRAAFTWMQKQREHALGLRLVTALWRFGYTRGYLSETRSWLDAVLETSPESSSMRAEALNAAGVLASVQGDIATATVRHNEARELSQELGDRRGIALALNGLGNVAEVEGDRDLAFRRYEAARSLFRDIGDKRGVAVMLTNLGNLHWEADALDEAIAHHEDAQKLFRQVGDPRGLAWAATNLGTLAIEQGDLSVAMAHLRDAFGFYQELGDQAGIIETLERFADIAGAGGQRERQARLLAAAASVREAINVPVTAGHRDQYESTIAALREQLGDSFNVTWKLGRALTLDEVAEIAVAAEPVPVERRAQPPSSDEPSDHRLTPRELDVLRLMADGLTNQEIADRLYLSTRTVTSHASNILNKLELGTRTAAVAYAIRNDLA